ncbi:TRAP transporter, DctM subunit [Acetomicrobium thermoterrenum DSM 13490]|uniref:TRAP transporter, DctM subunit n=1 Tax=Acetomicrobium thermoterrenum DSM 13490 TaxID=1120987 RepID=A0A1H3FCG0_9BACT|nr:TRAP transporter large permease [Acetomicrobium thermoterrenum]SDX88681.1 TRAP transporter, DctM subunit [Acetomicrobium thermoterrenum DSM 13490]
MGMLTVSIVFLILLFIGMPLAFTIGISASLFFVVDPYIPFSIAAQRMIGSLQNYPLLAVPFFVLAGNLMNATGITDRLIKFSTILTGHLIGGLAHVNIVLSALMGGLSGSAVADAAMESRILGPAMIKQGFDRAYTAAVTAMSSLITATIPPSIGFILYGYVGQVSIGRLFIAGIIPGILMAIVLMVTAYITSKKRGYAPVRPRRFTFSELRDSFLESIWALIFPLLLIGGIRFGLFTPTEGGAFAVVYAAIIGMFIYKELSWEKVKLALSQSVVDIGVILLIIACSGIFGYAIITDQVPQKVAVLITSVTTNPTLLLFIIMAFLFVAGMLMEATVNTLLLTPIFLPIIRSIGIDPVHFGIIMMTIVTLGGMTPPVGAVVYTVCSLLDVSVEKYVIQSIPFLVAIVVLIILFALVPDIVLILPRLIYGS